MLFSTINEGDVVTLKTIAGEEIVARYVEDKDIAYVVRKPMTLIQNHSGVGLLPYVLTTEEDVEVTINKHALSVNPIKSEESMSAQYIEASSDIKLAK